VNLNGLLEMADALRTFGFIFIGDIAPPCLDAVDTNDSGSLDLSDGIYTLSYLFLGAVAPPGPFPEVGTDPTPDGLACLERAPCTEWVNSIGMRLLYVPAGTFFMGSPEGERARWPREGPLHRVTLSRAFHLGATEVTQGQYERVMGLNPSHFNGGEFGVDLDRPVERVLWGDAVEFCVRLSNLEGRPYRLPTEAEWEYACRAGTTTRFSFGDALECDDACLSCPEVDGNLWYCGNDSPTGTKRVGTLEANPWCLHDMHGGVWEWVADWTDRYGAEDAVDPPGPETGEEKVIRGGYWGLELQYCRSAMRGDLSTDDRFDFLGFRVVLDLEDPEA
jgi:formylglycine-generating enzyme required for sulfatase activity